MILCPSHLPPLKKEEALRYAMCRPPFDEETLSLLERATMLAEGLLKPAAIYDIFPVTILDGRVCIGGYSFHSVALCRHLQGCERACLLAATLGLSLDRLIRRETVRSPAMGLMLSALGSERVERVCDLVQTQLQSLSPCGITSRFSPGYADLPLETQHSLFRLLGCEKSLGLKLTASCQMIPEKSVTAIIGLHSQPGIDTTTGGGCETCTLAGCMFTKQYET